jgi:hypothetical protein
MYLMYVLRLFKCQSIRGSKLCMGLFNLSESDYREQEVLQPEERKKEPSLTMVVSSQVNIQTAVAAAHKYANYPLPIISSVHPTVFVQLFPVRFTFRDAVSLLIQSGMKSLHHV